MSFKTRLITYLCRILLFCSILALIPTKARFLEGLAIDFSIFRSSLASVGEGGAWPGVYPGLYLLFLPFTALPFDIGFSLFSSLNIAATIFLFLYTAHKLGFSIRLHASSPSSLYIYIALFLFVSTSPVQIVSKVGQLSMLAYALFVYAAFGSHKIGRACALGVGVALKFSLFFFLLPLLFVKRHYAVVVYGTLLFLFFSCAPIFFGYDLGNIYTDYFDCIVQKTVLIGGYDTYASSPNYTFVHFEFLKMNYLNILGKGLFFLIGLGVLYKERERPYLISLESLLLLSSLTMELSYHRVYDTCFIMALLFLQFVALCTQKRYRTLCLFSLLMSGYLFLFKLFIGRGACMRLGYLIGENRWIHLCPAGPHYLNFPGYAFLMLALTLWACWSYRFSRKSFAIN